MSEEVQRFEYLLWFEGDWIPPMDIAEAIANFVQSKGGTPLHAGYGTLHVPREDVGEDPHSFDKTANEEEQ